MTASWPAACSLRASARNGTKSPSVPAVVTTMRAKAVPLQWSEVSEQHANVSGNVTEEISIGMLGDTYEGFLSREGSYEPGRVQDVVGPPLLGWAGP